MTRVGSGLGPLETASGLVLGLEAPPDGSGTTGPRGSPLAELERAVLPALLRPPCLVSFSGGRDSSTVLAVATRVARREGLELPVPATNRFASVAASDEDEWQERVVSDLGLPDWPRLEHEGDLDLVGPLAAEGLRRHGLIWPFNAHFHIPLLRLAAGGSLLTGIGGDELLTGTRWSGVANALLGRRRPGRRDLLRLGFVAAPRPVRRRALAGNLPLPFPWLRPAARRELARTWAAHSAGEPLRWEPHLRWVRRLRYLQVGTESLRRLADDDDVQLVHPFLDDGFAGALARLPRSERFIGRTALMQALFRDVLPDDVLARSTKASFDGAFWNAASRAFAAQWDGSGVDPELVDTDALREEWASESPDARSFTLAQSAWLAGSGNGVEQAGHPLRQ
jgi:asparagine synthetase B (glutamine-hydrolysing)